MQYAASPHRWTRRRASTAHLEHGFDGAFGGALNPLKHLGALAFLLFWLLAATGIVLYVVLDTSAQGAYRSIDELSREPWSFGSALRSLHRYAADAFVVVTLAHLAREWLLGRFSGFRRFSWLTGVPLLPLAYRLRHRRLLAELGPARPVLRHRHRRMAGRAAVPGLAAGAQFPGRRAVSDRLFSLFVFVHLGVPLLLVFGLWFHIQRISRAEVFPPRALALGTAASLLALALVLPVRSQGPADLGVVPGALALDWFLLFIHPLADATSAAFVWALLLAALALLFALPFLRAPLPGAGGAGRPRPLQRLPPLRRRLPLWRDHAWCRIPTAGAACNWRRSARQLCASCGICVGSCPSSTPFRGVQALVTGIDMPQWPIDALRRRLVQGLAALRGERRYVVFGCDQGARVTALAAPDVLPFSLACTGMLPPSFVEYALRGGADGVLVAGCREGGCEFRLGQRWTAERLQGEREPHLRTTVAPDRWHTVWADAGDEAGAARGAATACVGRPRNACGSAVEAAA